MKKCLCPLEISADFTKTFCQIISARSDHPLSYGSLFQGGNPGSAMVMGNSPQGNRSQFYGAQGPSDYAPTGGPGLQQPTSTLYSMSSSGNPQMMSSSRQGFQQARAPPPLDTYGGGNMGGSMYDYNAGGAFSPFPNTMLQRDPQYQQHLNESQYSMMGGPQSSAADQSPLPTTLSDYYMAQQQQQPQRQFNSSQNANLYGLMMSQPHISASGAMYHQTAPAPYNHEGMPPPHATKPKKRRAKSFPEKLMKVLMDHTNEKAYAWLPDGKSFVVVHPDTFVKAVLNKGFKASKYASFVRKLHRWGFVRLTSGTGTDCFHHPMFVRGEMAQVGQIACVPTMGQLAEKPPSLVGVERFIRSKVVESALDRGMDMRMASRSTEVGTMRQGMKEQAPVDDNNHANSSTTSSKADVGWGDSVRYDSNYEASLDADVSKAGENSTSQTTDKEVPEGQVSNGEISPHPLQPKLKMLSKPGGGPQSSMFFNACHEAKPSGLEELANVANGLREQSMRSAAL